MRQITTIFDLSASKVSLKLEFKLIFSIPDFSLLPSCFLISFFDIWIVQMNCGKWKRFLCENSFFMKGKSCDYFFGLQRRICGGIAIQVFCIYDFFFNRMEYVNFVVIISICSLLFRVAHDRRAHRHSHWLSIWRKCTQFHTFIYFQLLFYLSIHGPVENFPGRECWVKKKKINKLNDRYL